MAKKKKDDEEKDIFKLLKDSIEKNVKGMHVSVLSESDIAAKKFWIKTPCLDLNRILSGSLYKGIQSRNLVGIIGPEHTMKSSFMVLCMAEAQKSGYKPIIIDTEGGVDVPFCERWGLDTKNVLYNYTPWIHEVKSVLAQIRESGEEGFIIGLDSVGGLERYKAFEDALEGNPKADQGLLAKEIRGMLKLLLNICIGQNSIGIACGHYYGSPGMIPMPDKVGGGKAMKLFPSILISLQKRKLLDENKNVIGNEIDAITLKNRVYPPFQRAVVHLDYKNGVRHCAGLMELGIEAGIITQKGSWYSWKEERLGQGIKNAMEALENNKEIFDEIDEWLKNTGYSSTDKELKEANILLDSEVELNIPQEVEEVNMEEVEINVIEEEMEKKPKVTFGKKK